MSWLMSTTAADRSTDGRSAGRARPVARRVEAAVGSSSTPLRAGWRAVGTRITGIACCYRPDSWWGYLRARIGRIGNPETRRISSWSLLVCGTRGRSVGPASTPRPAGPPARGSRRCGLPFLWTNAYSLLAPASAVRAGLVPPFTPCPRRSCLLSPFLPCLHCPPRRYRRRLLRSATHRPVRRARRGEPLADTSRRMGVSPYAMDNRSMLQPCQDRPQPFGAGRPRVAPRRPRARRWRRPARGSSPVATCIQTLFVRYGGNPLGSRALHKPRNEVSRRRNTASTQAGTSPSTSTVPPAVVRISRSQRPPCSPRTGPASITMASRVPPASPAHCCEPRSAERRPPRPPTTTPVEWASMSTTRTAATIVGKNHPRRREPHNEHRSNQTRSCHNQSQCNYHPPRHRAQWSSARPATPGEAPANAGRHGPDRTGRCPARKGASGPEPCAGTCLAVVWATSSRQKHRGEPTHITRRRRDYDAPGRPRPPRRDSRNRGHAVAQASTLGSATGTCCRPHDHRHGTTTSTSGGLERGRGPCSPPLQQPAQPSPGS